MSEEFELGQVLVELGYTTLERIREGLDIQQKMRGMGIVPKPLEDILREKGYVTAEQLAEAKAKGSAGSSEPAKIPGYRLVRKIGRGGMGTVYEGVQESIDRPVAVKILHSKIAREPGYVQRFLREARAAAKLSHPNIVTGIDVGEAAGRSYFVMEYVEGETLRRRLMRGGRVSEAEALGIGVQIARALEHASRFGFVHRDVKPENIILMKDGTAKLCDLGLARRSGSEIAEEGAFGTAEYVAPEQIRGRTDLDVRTDIYALGATLYHLLAGDPPFLGSKKEILQHHLSRPPTPIREWRRDVSERTSRLLGKMLQKDRILRHQTAGELAAEIEEVLRGVGKPPAEVIPAARPVAAEVVEGVAVVEEAPRPKPVAPAPAPAPPAEEPKEEAAPARAGAPRRIPARTGKHGFPISLVVALVVLIIAVFVPWGKVADLFRSGPPDVTGNGPEPNGGKPDPNDADREREREAIAELEAIAEIKKSDPDFLRSAEILRRLELFQNKHYGTEWERRGRKEVEWYRQEAEQRARRIFEDLRRKAAECIREDRLREAIEIYGRFPDQFHELTETGENVLSEIQRLRQRIHERYAADMAEAEESVRRKDYDTALDILEGMETYATPGKLAEIESKKKEVRALRREQFKGIEQEIADKYYRIDLRYREQIRKRQYRAAANAVALFLYGQTWDEERSRLLHLKKVDYEALEKSVQGWSKGDAGKRQEILAHTRPALEGTTSPADLTIAELVLLDLRNAAGLSLFLDRVDAGVEELADRKERISFAIYENAPGFFDRREEKVVYLIENRKIMKNLKVRLDFPVLDLMAIAERTSPDPGADGDLQFWGGLLYYYSGNLMYVPRATTHLARAAELDVPGAALYRARVDKALLARTADEILKRIEAAIKARSESRWYDVERNLEAALAHEGHPLLKEKRKEIDTMLEEAARKIVEIEQKERRYRGEITDEGGGRLTVRYDFESKEQLEAFVPVESQRARWRIRGGGLEKTTTSFAALQWRYPVKGDVVVEYDVTALEAQNIVTTLYYEQGKKEHYSFYIGLDIIGRKQDPQNAVEENNGMPKHCIVKHPVRVDEENWALPGFWKEWKSRLVGKTLGPFDFETRRVHRVRAERAGKVLRLSIDGVGIWQGEDEAYKEGKILLQSDSRIQIDNLSITFTPAE